MAPLASLYAICTLLVQYLYVYKAYKYCTYTVQVLYNGRTGRLQNGCHEAAFGGGKETFFVQFGKKLYFSTLKRHVGRAFGLRATR